MWKVRRSTSFRSVAPCGEVFIVLFNIRFEKDFLESRNLEMFNAKTRQRILSGV